MNPQSISTHIILPSSPSAYKVTIFTSKLQYWIKTNT